MAAPFWGEAWARLITRFGWNAFPIRSAPAQKQLTNNSNPLWTPPRRPGSSTLVAAGYWILLAHVKSPPIRWGKENAEFGAFAYPSLPAPCRHA